MFFIDNLLLAPISGLKFILNQVQKVADQELNDESLIKHQLLELQMRLELGEVSDEDFREQEADLFARLRVIRRANWICWPRCIPRSRPRSLSNPAGTKRAECGAGRETASDKEPGERLAQGRQTL